MEALFACGYLQDPHPRPHIFYTDISNMRPIATFTISWLVPEYMESTSNLTFVLRISS